MTVRRSSNAHYEAPPEVVATAVRSVLSRRRRYIHVNEVKRSALFEANVRPAWWLTGTDMTIRLSGTPTGTVVAADTKSQFYIMGDVFGFYDSYIRSFLSDVQYELRGKS